MRSYTTSVGRYGNKHGGKKYLILGLAVAGGAYYYYYKKKVTNRLACEGNLPITRAPEKALGWTHFTTLTLREKQDIGKDSKLFRFNLPKQDQVSGHTVSSLVFVLVAKPGTENNWWPTYVYRPYTPISEERTLGHIDFVIKEYKHGVSSKYIHALKPGDKIAAIGPFDNLRYRANTHESIGMIAAGSGITPMFQLLHKIINNSEDKTKVNLLYCNRTEDDILLREELENISAKNPERFQVTFCLSQPPINWEQESGHVTVDMVKNHMPSPNEDTLIYVCGPSGMVQMLTQKKGILQELGYDKKKIYKF
ncbi:hypothetical protein BGW37DRAFT_52127 [Umbelopsis sp. PMI_123]|nr:hypothetical protein BGW37DRAFT_52127 [Umbelopsis sp. PMI_123]